MLSPKGVNLALQTGLFRVVDDMHVLVSVFHNLSVLSWLQHSIVDAELYLQSIPYTLEDKVLMIWSGADPFLTSQMHISASCDDAIILSSTLFHLIWVAPASVIELDKLSYLTKSKVIAKAWQYQLVNREGRCMRQDCMLQEYLVWMETNSSLKLHVYVNVVHSAQGRDLQRSKSRFSD